VTIASSAGDCSDDHAIASSAGDSRDGHAIAGAADHARAARAIAPPKRSLLQLPRVALISTDST